METIKNVENIRHTNVDLKSHTSSHCLFSLPLERYLNNHLFLNNLDKELLNKTKFTRKFIKDYPDVLFIKANKGNVTVALKKQLHFKY